MILKILVGFIILLANILLLSISLSPLLLIAKREIDNEPNNETNNETNNEPNNEPNN